MKNLRKSLSVFLGCICLSLMLGCASHTAPSGWLPRYSEFPGSARGGWMSVQFAKDQRLLEVHGEFLAFQQDSLFVLSEGGLIVIPATGVSSAKVTVFEPESKKLGLWTLLGTLSSITHGAFILISGPTWIIGGSSAAVSSSRQPLIEYPEDPLPEMGMYARFPQGLPADLDRQSLTLDLTGDF